MTRPTCETCRLSASLTDKVRKRIHLKHGDATRWLACPSLNLVVSKENSCRHHKAINPPPPETQA
jgi:hypothetical protein